MTPVPFARRSEDGMTLIEILVAMAILSIAVVTFVGAMTTMHVSTSHHRGLGATDNVVRNFGEAVKQQAIVANTWEKCPDAAAVTPSYTEANFTMTVTGVEYWVPDPASPTTYPRTGKWGTESDCEDYYDEQCRIDNTHVDTRPECDPSFERISITVTALAANMKGGQTKTQVLVRRGNT